MNPTRFTESVRMMRSLLRLSRVPPVLALTMGVLFSSTARADLDRTMWSEYLTDAASCERSHNGAVSESGRCLLGNGLKVALDQGLRVADAYGKKAFGQHFQVVGRMAHTPVQDGIAIHGDIDVVLPFGGAAAAFGRQGDSSLFFQQGVTRSWEDGGSNPFRNDLRHGMVRRFRISSAAEADIVGISAFHLFNTEHGHRVVVPGVDYAGRWGIGSFRYYLPTTGWRPGKSGQEERALEGLEIGMRFDLTTTLRLNTVGYRWKAEDGSHRWETGARLDLEWRPHPWLRFGAGYDGIGRSGSAATLGVALHLPLGGGSKPAWQGLGVGADESPPTAADLWRPVDEIGPIRVATRSSGSDLVGEATVSFLQRTVGSGDTIRLKVTLPAAAPEDVRVVVRLVPGIGNNPAVAGEDFVDHPAETTIRKGTTSSTVSFTLLRNDSMTGNRSLGATVSVAS